MRARNVVVVGLLVANGCGPPSRDDPDAEPPPPPPGGTLRAGYHLPGLTTGEWSWDQRIDLASGPDGLLVGGRFAQAGAVRSVPARWDGTEWSSMPSTDAHKLAVGADGTVYAAQKYDGCLECGYPVIRRLQEDQTWEIVPGIQGEFEALASTALGIVAVGRISDTQESSVVVLEGTTWRQLASAAGLAGARSVRAVAERNGVLCVGGSFEQLDGVAAANVACLTGTTWAQAGDGLDGEISALAFASDGRLVAGGRFNTAAGANLAVLDAGTWSGLGGGVDGPGASVEAIAIDGDAIVVGGSFASPAANLARYENAAWIAPPLPIGAVGPALVNDIVVRPDGVYVAGRFDLAGTRPVANIARWTATSLEPLIAPDDTPLGVTGEVRALIAHPNGGVIAGGDFVAAGVVPTRNAARLLDGAWEPMGDPAAPIEVLVRASDGAVMAGDDTGQLLRWSGTGWDPVGLPLGGAIRAIAELDGDLVVGGGFTATGAYVARWNGTNFEAMGSGVPAPVSALGRHSGQLCAGIAFGGDADPNLPTAQPLWCWDGVSWVADSTLRGTAVHAISNLSDGSTVLAGLLWFNGQARFVAQFTSSWEEVLVPGVYTARETVLAAAEVGAYIAVTNTVVWWDGDVTFVPIAYGDWTRALLPTVDGLFLAGRGLWEESFTAPVSAGIAEWR